MAESLEGRAQQNLDFIRNLMEQATLFTAVPGWGTVMMGLVALLGAVWAGQQPSDKAWLQAWLVTASLACAVGIFSMVHKQRSKQPSGGVAPFRKFLFNLCPPFTAGVILTGWFFSHGMSRYLPGVWLLLYGAGVMTAGVFSIKIVPLLGLCFMVVGCVTLWFPMTWGDYFMGLGFGGLQIVFGFIIARRYGG